MVLKSTTNLDTLIPPPVLPAQAPINISSTRMVFEVSGHISKSVVEKPVVVIIDATWKKACVRLSPTLLKMSSICIKITPTETTIISR